MRSFNGAAMLQKWYWNFHTTTYVDIWECGPATFCQALKCGRSRTTLNVVQLHRTKNEVRQRRTT